MIINTNATVNYRITLFLMLYTFKDREGGNPVLALA